MTGLLTAAQMRALEQAAIESGRVTGMEMMERAGAGVVEAIVEEWPELAAGAPRAVVLCGPGNNGGDGFVVARLLRARGWQVAVYFHGDAGRLPPDARTNFDRWQAMGGISPFRQDRGFDIPAGAVVVDALFGTGLSRPVSFTKDFLRGYDTLGDAHGTGGAKAVAIDFPSGVSSDTGACLGDALFADLTVTFHARKRGHVLGRGPEKCGKVVVKDIGL